MVPALKAFYFLRHPLEEIKKKKKLNASKTNNKFIRKNLKGLSLFFFSPQ